MSDTGSSIISALGAGSGINFNQLANDISEATYAFRLEDLRSRNAALEAQISAASVLRNALSQLSGALGDRIRNGDVAPRASIGNPGVARVSSASGTSPSGSYSLEVTQLAASQTLVLSPLASPDDAVGEGSLRIRFGTIEGAGFTEDTGTPALEVAVSAGDTLADLAARIRTQSDGALDAYVAQGDGGAQLVIKGQTGAASGFVLEATSTAPGPGGVPGDLTYLGWSPASDSGQLRASARDALFELDTVPMRSASNRVTGLPEGIELELTGTNADDPTTVAFTQDNAAITGVMADLTAALNDVVALLNGSAGDGGNLALTDAGARELRGDLSRLTNTVVMPSAAEGEPRTLADLGLSLNRDGTFALDNERLSRTLSEAPDAAAAMFTTGVFGVFATIDKLARNNTALADPGSLGGSIRRYESQIERNDARLERIAQQQEALRASLAKSFTAAESRIATSQSTLSFLRQQFEVSDDN
jgi:flagellar hook-associated protein 2